ncbi:hypothetical protein D3C77_416140 [compost metagenome]
MQRNAGVFPLNYPAHQHLHIDRFFAGACAIFPLGTPEGVRFQADRPQRRHSATRQVGVDTSDPAQRSFLLGIRLGFLIGTALGIWCCNSFHTHKTLQLNALDQGWIAVGITQAPAAIVTTTYVRVSPR